MKEHHVTSRELSQALVDAGIVLDTCFYWVVVKDSYKLCIKVKIDGIGFGYVSVTDGQNYSIQNPYSNKDIPAPMSSDLGEVLPVYIDGEHRQFKLRIVKEFNGYVVCYTNFAFNAVPHIIDDKLADGLCRMLLYLVKEGIVTVDSLKKKI